MQSRKVLQEISTAQDAVSHNPPIFFWPEQSPGRVPTAPAADEVRASGYRFSLLRDFHAALLKDSIPGPPTRNSCEQLQPLVAPNSVNAARLKVRSSSGQLRRAGVRHRGASHD